MKSIIPLFILISFFTSAFAQSTSDSLAYNLQRKKINGMLARRTQKFGQYDNSLSKHTGIFGLQTKKDIRRSNDILMDIVKTDNEIYKQLKILLDYRTFQQTQVLDHSKENEKVNLTFMRTINKLQDQNQKLRKDAEQTAIDQEKSTRNYMLVISLLIIASLWLLWRNYSRGPVNIS